MKQPVIRPVASILIVSAIITFFHLDTCFALDEVDLVHEEHRESRSHRGFSPRRGYMLNSRESCPDLLSE